MTITQKRNMLGDIKSFDKTDHEIYDTKGKKAMLDFLNRKFEKFNLLTIENPNPYGIDLLTMNSMEKVIYCWEVEVRYGNWKGDVSFPFDKINCIERKDYQWRKDKELFDKIPFQLANEFKVIYAQLNDECTRAVLIEGDTILDYRLKPWSNRKADNEYVRQVPIEKTLQVKLTVAKKQQS